MEDSSAGRPLNKGGTRAHFKQSDSCSGSYNLSRGLEMQVGKYPVLRQSAFSLPVCRKWCTRVPDYFRSTLLVYAHLPHLYCSKDDAIPVLLLLHLQLSLGQLVDFMEWLKDSSDSVVCLSWQSFCCASETAKAIHRLQLLLMQQ